MAYADDVAIIAEDKVGMKGLIRSLEKYFRGKGISSKHREDENDEV